MALLDAAAAALGGGSRPRLLEGRLISSVPIERDLDLEGHADGGAVTVTILEAGQPLTSVTLTPRDADAAPADRPWIGGGRGAGWPLPLSDHCLACGARNPLGLQLGLSFDEEGVWARLQPREPWRAPAERLHLALASVLLDELAWWLGALVAKEGGLTNRIRLTLLRPDTPFRGPLTAAGRFADVTPVDRKHTFWRTRSALLGADGELMATASIVFRAGADYSTRQMAFFRARTPADIFRRMFPNYAG